MKNLLILIGCVIGLLTFMHFYKIYVMEDQQINQLILKGENSDPQTISYDNLKKILGKHYSSNKFDISVQTRYPKSTIAIILMLISGMAGFLVSQAIIALINWCGTIPIRKQMLRWCHSWIKQYGICRTGSRELLKNYYELLKIVSSGISVAYEKPTIFLTFNGTVTDLIIRYKDNEMLRDIFKHWRKLKKKNSIDVKRVFAPPPYKWKLINDELEKVSLDIYSIVTGSIETFWTHSQDEWAWEQIKKAQELSPGLDFALFEGKTPVNTEFSPRACVGYIKNSLVYKLQTTDIKEHGDYYTELIKHCKNTHQEIIDAVNNTPKGHYIANFIECINKLPLIKQKRQKKKEELLAELKELLQELKKDGEITV